MTTIIIDTKDTKDIESNSTPPNATKTIPFLNKKWIILSVIAILCIIVGTFGYKYSSNLQKKIILSPSTQAQALLNSHQIDTPPPSAQTQLSKKKTVRFAETPSIFYFKNESDSDTESTINEV